MSVCARGQSEARWDGVVPHGGDNSGAQAAIRRTPAFEDAVGGGSSRRSSVAAPRWHPETRRACPDGSAGIARGGLAPQIDHICAQGGHAGRRCGDCDAVGPGCANSAFPAHETPGGCSRGQTSSAAGPGRWHSAGGAAGSPGPPGPGWRGLTGREARERQMDGAERGLLGKKFEKKKFEQKSLEPPTSTEPPLIAPKSFVV